MKPVIVDCKARAPGVSPKPTPGLSAHHLVIVLPVQYVISSALRLGGGVND
jgi:hypothetical protein